MGRQSKKFQMQGLRILRSEAYLPVRRNDERWSITQPFGFAQGHESFGYTQDREPVERPVEWQLDFLQSRH